MAKIKSLSTLSEQIRAATIPLMEINSVTSKFFDNSALRQMNLISEQIRAATIPLMEINSVTSNFFDNSALLKINVIAEQIKATKLPYLGINPVAVNLFENLDSFQLESKLKFISENINLIAKLDIEELSNFEIKSSNEENNNLIKFLEEIKSETFNNKFKVEEMNKQFEILIKIAEKQKDSIIINIILGLIVSILFTYFIQPIINLSVTKSEINKILVSEIKQSLGSNNLSNYRVVVVEDYLNVRIKPKLKSEVIFHLSNGDLVEIVNKQKNWTLIKKYDSENETIIEGWVNTRYLLKLK